MATRLTSAPSRRLTLVLNAFTRWGVDHRGWAPRTRKKYAGIVRRADRWLHENEGKSVLWADLKDLRKFLFVQAPSEYNRNQIRQALAAFGEFAVDEGYWDANAALSLPRYRLPDPLPKALSPAQARAVEKTANEYGGIIEAMVSTFLYAALRRAELRELTWADFEPEEGWLKVRGKGKKERSIPVHDKLHLALLRWRSECVSGRWV